MSLPIDVDGMVDFLVGLLETPSPTGDTGEAAAYIQAGFSEFPFELEQSPKGLLAGMWPGTDDSAPRALTAHFDTLGAMVSQIRPNGRLRLTQLGGWMWSSVEGIGVTVLTDDGRSYRGAILPDAASIHANSNEQLNAKRTDRNMEVRIDAVTRSAKETAALGIGIGDIVVFDPCVEVTDTGFIRSRHLDDKAGVAAIYGAIKAIAAAGLKPAQRTTIHFSNYEEVGHGAAAGLPDDLHELLTVDMAVVGPNRLSSEFVTTICAKDSRGPYDLRLRRHLEQLAATHNIPSVVDVYPYYGSDGGAYWRSGGNVAVGLIGPGVDASHHYERTHRDALEASASLIAAYLLVL